MKSAVRTRCLRGLSLLAVAVVLAGVFAAYLNPHLLLDLSNRLWACF